MFEASKVIYRYELGWPAWTRNALPWQAIKMVLTAFVLNYAAMSFLVLTWKDTWGVWTSVGLLGHLILFLILLIGTVLPPKRGHKHHAAPIVTPTAAPAEIELPEKKAE